jgi:hypothetical protein
MRSRTIEICAGLMGLLLLGVQSEARGAELKGITFLQGQYDVVVKDCREQAPNGQAEACLTALRQLQIQLPTEETDATRVLREQIGYRMAIAEAYKQSAGAKNERPDQFYRNLFKAYAAIPQNYFPFEEVLPTWNLYLREEYGRAKFSRYRKLKLMVRAGEEQKDLEEQYFANIQQRLLDYGFSLLNPTSTASSQPDVLMKVQLKGETVDIPSNPRLQGKKVYRLTLDIQSFKFRTANKAVEPFVEELEEGASLLEAARIQSVNKGSERLANLLFYYTLREMFQPTPTGG